MVMIPSPSMKSKFSTSTTIKHSPYMKEKAKSTLWQSKQFNALKNENAKNLLNQFALNIHDVMGDTIGQTKTFEVKKGLGISLQKQALKEIVNKKKTFTLGGNLEKKDKKFDIIKEVDDFNSIKKNKNIRRKKVNSTIEVWNTVNDNYTTNPKNNEIEEDSAENPYYDQQKSVLMRRKYRCYLKDLKDQLTSFSGKPINSCSVDGEIAWIKEGKSLEHKQKNKEINQKKVSINIIKPSPTSKVKKEKTTSSSIDSDPTAFKYNFSNIFQEQIIDEEEEEIKDIDEDIKHEGYLYKIIRAKHTQRRYYKWIQKDWYTYEHQEDSNHTNLHNWSGIFIEQWDNITFKGQLFYVFRLISPKKSRDYYCDNEDQYKMWLLKIRSVTGFSNLCDWYSFKMTLGQGKFAVVKLATKLTSGEEVAIKIIKKTEMTPKELELFRTEIEIMKISNHPYIAKLYEVFENREDIYIIMELCKGGDLFSYLEKRQFKLSEHRAAQIIRQILMALFSLHSFGIVHRDLKPENIMMFNDTEVSQIRLIDFGLGKLIGPNEKCSESFGTLGYVAPEVLMEISYDKTVDYWSCGILAYWLITGCLPFDHENPKEIIRQTIFDSVPYPKDLWENYSTESKHFVMNFLQKNPEKRMNIKAAWEHPWIKYHQQIDSQLYNQHNTPKISKFLILRNIPI